jgi:hypothetical protein
MVVLTVIAIVGAGAGGVSYRRTRTRVRERPSIEHHPSVEDPSLDHGPPGAPEEPVDIPPRVVRNGRKTRVGGQP